MKDLAPEIMRQRLLIEGKFTVDVDEQFIRNYFEKLSTALELRTYGPPIIFSPGGEGKDGNQGYDAFVPLIDSGIALYVWTASKFMSCVIYTCKSFDSDVAVASTQDMFNLSAVEFSEF